MLNVGTLGSGEAYYCWFVWGVYYAIYGVMYAPRVERDGFYSQISIGFGCLLIIPCVCM